MLGKVRLKREKHHIPAFQPNSNAPGSKNQSAYRGESRTDGTELPSKEKYGSAVQFY